LGVSPEAWMPAAPRETDQGMEWGAYGASENLPSPQAVSSLWPTAAPSTQRKEVSIVEATQK
jgi:hypothetical protein